MEIVKKYKLYKTFEGAFNDFLIPHIDDFHNISEEVFSLQEEGQLQTNTITRYQNEDFLIDVVNNETYLILNRENIINYKLLNMYYNNNDNIFVLKNIKTNNFKIILFISNIYIKTNIDIIYNYSNEQINFIYGSKLTQQMYTMLKHIDYQSNILLLSLDNSLLTIKTNNIDNFSFM
jgi:ribosome biogenesis protein Nip4